MTGGGKRGSARSCGRAGSGSLTGEGLAAAGMWQRGVAPSSDREERHRASDGRRIGHPVCAKDGTALERPEGNPARRNSERRGRADRELRWLWLVREEPSASGWRNIRKVREGGHAKRFCIADLLLNHF